MAEHMISMDALSMISIYKFNNLSTHLSATAINVNIFESQCHLAATGLVHCCSVPIY